MRTCLLLALLFVQPGASAQRPYGDSILQRLQAGTGTGDLQIRTDSVRGTYVLRDVHFAVDPGDSASALWVAPRDSSRPRPLVLFQHWGGGDRRSFLPDMKALAARGYACLSLDAPWLWPSADTTADPLRVYPDNIQRSVRAFIHLLDVLSKRPSIDPDRIYFIGHSYGATLGGVLLPAEPRIRAAVFMAGLPSLSRSMEEDPLGQWKSTKEKQRGIYDSALYRLSLMEPERLIGRAYAPVFYQAASADQYVVRRHSEEYIAAVRPARTSWYATDHLFASDSALNDRVGWIVEQDSVVARGARGSRELLQRAAEKMGTTDAAKWRAQHWVTGRIPTSGDNFLSGVPGDAEWTMRLPDTVSVHSRHLPRSSEWTEVFRLWKDSAWRFPLHGGWLQPLRDTTLRNERLFYYACWLSLCSPAGIPGVQVQPGLGKSHSVQGVWVLLRPWPPVLLTISAVSALPQQAAWTGGGVSFSDYRPAAGALRPFRYVSLGTRPPFTELRLKKISLP